MILSCGTTQQDPPELTPGFNRSRSSISQKVLRYLNASCDASLLFTHFIHNPLIFPRSLHPCTLSCYPPALILLKQLLQNKKKGLSQFRLLHPTAILSPKAGENSRLLDKDRHTAYDLFKQNNSQTANSLSAVERSPEPQKIVKWERADSIGQFPSPNPHAMLPVLFSREWTSREWRYRMLSGWYCLSTVLKKEEDDCISVSYSIVSVLNFWIVLFVTSCTGPFWLHITFGTTMFSLSKHELLQFRE